tara:strand:+ start:1624 stop:1932 length:309 start_codon:yes stop_codon:yes gene_type:complete
MKQNSVFMVANKKNIFAYLWYNFFMEREISVISTLHISSGSFELNVYSDQTGEVEIFGKRFPVKLNNNKIEIETNLSAKQFGGAEGRDYFLKWLKMEMMENC